MYLLVLLRIHSVIPWHGDIYKNVVPLSLLTPLMSGRLCTITLSVCMFVSLRIFTFWAFWLVELCVGTAALNAVCRVSHIDSSGKLLPSYQVTSYIQVMPVCYMHSICVPTVSSLSLHILHITSPCCWSICASIALVLSGWSSDSIRNPSVSFWRPPVVSQAQFFESTIRWVCHELSVEFGHPFL